MKARTHFAEAAKVSFDYGPYLIHEKLTGVALLDELNRPLDFLLKKRKPKLQPCGQNSDNGQQNCIKMHPKPIFMLKRIQQVNEPIYKALQLDKNTAKKTGEL